METAPGTGNGSVVDESHVALRLAWDCYAPTNEINLPHAIELGRLIFAKCGLEIQHASNLEEVLPVVAQHVTECGVPKKMLEEWADKHRQLTLITQGMSMALRLAKIQAATFISQIPPSVPRDRHIPYAVKRIAETAYEGKERQSKKPHSHEREEYITHPTRVAAMALATFKTLHGEGFVIEDSLIADVVNGCLLHDAGEEAQYRPGAFDPRRPETKFSPLFVSEVLSQLGSQSGLDIAHSNRLLTHFPKQVGAPGYVAYIRRGLGDTPGRPYVFGQENLLFMLIKFADVQHNRLTPKEIPEGDTVGADKIRKKQANYAWAMDTIAAEASVRRDGLEKPEWLPRYFGTMRTMRIEDLPTYELALEAYMDRRDAAKKDAA